MQSDVEDLKDYAHKAIQELINLKQTKAELESNLRALNARRDDLQIKRSAELQRGKEIRREVENWLNDVEQIKDEAQKNEERIKQLCAPENIQRIVKVTSSETSSSNVNHVGNAAVYGLGGVGNTSNNLDGSIINTNIRDIINTQHNHYHGNGTK